MSRSSARSSRVQDARGLRADDRPVAAARAPTSVAAASVEGPGSRLEERARWSFGQVGGERRIDAGDAPLEGELLLRRRSRSRCPVVKSYCGGTASRAAARAASVWAALSNSTALGAMMSRGREVAGGQRQRLLGQDVGPEDRGQDRATRIAAAIPRRVASLRVNRAIASARWVSIGQCVRQSPSWRGEVGLRQAAATMPLTTLPSARPRVRGDSQPMTLPRSRADVAPVAAIPSSTSAAISASLRASGRYSRRMAISASSLVGEVLATGPAERLDRLAARLDLAGQDGQELVVGQGRALPLLDVVGGVRRPSAACRGAARHRRAWRWRYRSGFDLEGTPVLATSGGGRPSRGLVPDARGAQGRSGAGVLAQPACVRAFFLRFASLRLRFTDGFS